MGYFRTICYLVIIAALVCSCIEPYGLPENKSTATYLVVDGFLDSGIGEVQVRLTRSRALSEGGALQIETNAVIKLEEMNGNMYTLVESANGVYSLTDLSVDPAKNYRLAIQTLDGKTYASSFVDVAQTPAIDSVTWLPSPDGVSFRVNTHNDDPQSFRYYLWRYDETWEYTSREYSAYKYEGDTALPREADEILYTCWSSNGSTDILVKSTDRLSANIVSQFQINKIPAGDRRLGVKYSLLVKQVCLDKESYEFWSKLEQTTENVGGLFDPQPGQVLGNIVCVSDPTEPALGIFHAANVTEKRFFLSYGELPDYLADINKPPICEIDTILVDVLPDFPSSGNLLLNQLRERISVIGYTYTAASCADCRFEGGTITKPLFWED